MDDHELLLRHAEKWAAERGRVFDRDLVDTAIELRATHDGLAANRWPARTVEHLMLERWPSHGPLEAPDTSSLVASLETFWRFLRTTGRMAGSSAEPAKLVQEARKAAPKMAAACADHSRFGANKSLFSFGREIGIEIDDVPTLEELQDRLQRIGDAWNALPAAERLRRSGDSADAGSRMSRAMTAGMSHLLDVGELPPGWSLPATPRLDEDDEGEYFLPRDPGLTAPLVRSSAYVRQVLALCDWVGDGREVTDIGVLRPAVAREAYSTLGLWEWDLADLRSMSNRPAPEALDRMKDDWLHVWRSAAECFALDRLWVPALDAGLITLKGKVARRNPAAIPRGDLEWSQLGHVLLLALRRRSDPIHAAPLLGILLTLQSEFGGGPATVERLRDWWWANPENTLREVLGDEMEQGRFLSDRTLDRSLFMFGDTGLWNRRGRRIVSTHLGWDFGLILASADEQGLFDE